MILQHTLFIFLLAFSLLISCIPLLHFVGEALLKLFNEFLTYEDYFYRYKFKMIRFTAFIATSWIGALILLPMTLILMALVLPIAMIEVCVVIGHRIQRHRFTISNEIKSMQHADSEMIWRPKHWLDGDKVIASPEFKSIYSHFKQELDRLGSDPLEQMVALEKEIRQAILKQIEYSLKKEQETCEVMGKALSTAYCQVARYLNEVQQDERRYQKLITGNEKEMKKARDVFSIGTDVGHVAWRCYDYQASENYQETPNYNSFIYPIDSWNIEDYSTVIPTRLVSALVFKVATDEKCSESLRNDMMQDYVAALFEIRRTDDEDFYLDVQDSISCDGGAFARFGLALMKHPHFAIKREGIEQAREVALKTIVRELNSLLYSFHYTEEEKNQLFISLIYFNEKNRASILDKKPMAGFDGEAILYDKNLLTYRKHFIDHLNKNILPATPYRHLIENYFKLIGCDFAADVTNVYRTWQKRHQPSVALKAAATPAGAKAPTPAFSLFTGSSHQSVLGNTDLSPEGQRLSPAAKPF